MRNLNDIKTKITVCKSSSLWRHAMWFDSINIEVFHHNVHYWIVKKAEGHFKP